MKRRPHLATLLLPLLLSACGGLLPQPEALDIYRLPAHAIATTTDHADVLAKIQLRIDLPQADGLLASRNIAVAPDDNRISIYHGARWNQPAPELVRDRLVRAFREAGRLHAVFGDAGGLPANFSLTGQLDAFQAEIHDAGTPVVVIGFNAILVSNSGREVIATRRFTVNEVAADGAVPAVVDAFGAATDQLAHDVVEWADTAMAQAAQ